VPIKTVTHHNCSGSSLYETVTDFNIAAFVQQLSLFHFIYAQLHVL